MATSVLEIEYVYPTRPYSQNELKDMQEKLYHSLRLGTTRAVHKRCNHFYIVKENGRKEKEIQEQSDEDVGNCSVCWKINKTPRHLKVQAKKLVTEYCNTFYNQQDDDYMYYDRLDLETAFYKWLYTDNY